MEWTVYAGYPHTIIIAGKKRGSRALMSRDGVRYFYARQTGRKLSILEIQDAANLHAMETYGTLAGFRTDLAFVPRKPSKKQLERSERMKYMFSDLLVGGGE